MSTRPEDLPHEWEISFLTEVIPEEGDTLDGLKAYVEDLATEWLPDQFVFTVKPLERKRSYGRPF